MRPVDILAERDYRAGRYPRGPQMSPQAQHVLNEAYSHYEDGSGDGALAPALQSTRVYQALRRLLMLVDSAPTSIISQASAVPHTTVLKILHGLEADGAVTHTNSRGGYIWHATTPDHTVGDQ